MNSLSKIIAQWFLSVFLAPILVLLTGCGTTQYADQDSPSTSNAPAIGGTPVSVPPSAAGTQPNPAGPDTLRAGDRISVSFSGLPGPPIEKHEHSGEVGVRPLIVDVDPQLLQKKKGKV